VRLGPQDVKILNEKRCSGTEGVNHDFIYLKAIEQYV